MSGAPQPDDTVEVLTIMRALEPEVFDAVFAAVEPLLPASQADRHPLGCHRRRVPDRICLWAMLVRLVTGCSWVDAEQLVGNVVSDTTLRGRRDEWPRRESLRRWPTRCSLLMTRRSVSVSKRCASTVLCTRHLVEEKERAKAQ